MNWQEEVGCCAAFRRGERISRIEHHFGHAWPRGSQNGARQGCEFAPQGRRRIEFDHKAIEIARLFRQSEGAFALAHGGAADLTRSQALLRLDPLQRRFLFAQVLFAIIEG